MWEYRDEFVKGAKVLCREGKQVGTITGSQGRCMLEGCAGMRISTRWKNSKITRPCSQGLRWNAKRKMWQIA